MPLQAVPGTQGGEAGRPTQPEGGELPATPPDGGADTRFNFPVEALCAKKRPSSPVWPAKSDKPW